MKKLKEKAEKLVSEASPIQIIRAFAALEDLDEQDKIDQEYINGGRNGTITWLTKSTGFIRYFPTKSDKKLFGEDCEAVYAPIALGRVQSRIFDKPEMAILSALEIHHLDINSQFAEFAAKMLGL